jgi:enoyl-CoA hydratase/carnithine racemase
MPLKVENFGRVRKVSFNRPDKLNVFDNLQFAEVRDALSAADVSAEVAVVVLTGNGSAFSAGQDLHDMQRIIDGKIEEHHFPSFLESLSNFGKPLIGAVNGVAVGIGMTLLAYCDIVLMSRETRLRAPFPQLGLAPEAGSSGLFVSQMGWQNAAYTLFSGDWVSAEEALKFGYIWKISEPSELQQEAMELAGKISENPILSLVETKKLMLASGKHQLGRECHVREVEAYRKLMGGALNSEAARAFFEGRPVDFSRMPEF